MIVFCMMSFSFLEQCLSWRRVFPLFLFDHSWCAHKSLEQSLSLGMLSSISFPHILMYSKFMILNDVSRTIFELETASP